MLYPKSGTGHNNRLHSDRFSAPLRGSKPAREQSVKSVVVPELGDKQSVIRDFVHHSVFFVDSARPVTGEAVLEGLRFTNTFEWFSLGLFDQLVDSVKDLFVGFLPVQIVFPGVLGEDEFHSRSSFS
jgi:hypothetical protein